MQLWTLSAPAQHIEAPAGLDVTAFAMNLISGIGGTDFSGHTLAALNDAWSFASWSVYRIGVAQPHMYVSGSFRIPDTTTDCWAAYRSGLHQHDQTFQRALRDQPAGTLALTRWGAEEIRRPHREQIYLRHGVRERVSLAQSCGHGEVLAVNLYRHDHEAPVRPQVVRDLQELGPVLFACVKRHLTLLPSLELTRPAPTPQEVLLQHCPHLTERELEVCLRLLRGLTYDGIGADLGISPTTAKTYRNRAFRRLDIQHRNQLFRLVLDAGLSLDPAVLSPED